MLLCPKCGRPNTTKSSYCETCLTEFPSEMWDHALSQKLLCPECHAENPKTNRFCDVCHEQLAPGQSE